MVAGGWSTEGMGGRRATTHDGRNTGLVIEPLPRRGACWAGPGRVSPGRMNQLFGSRNLARVHREDKALFRSVELHEKGPPCLVLINWIASGATPFEPIPASGARR
ncbi:hypothetical protein GCM10023175_28500 [Pseudonocardia xishanensis]|uniref:Uncharacterized protein n=1 Tax=Pseudonocardia xishanensis TaxID=630995 RepID=A0ABP8RSZ3_9PSEU